MDWIYIGVLLNTIFTGGFPDEEKCLGHKAIMERDHKIVGTCIKAPGNSSYFTTNGAAVLQNGCTLVFSDGRPAC